MNNLRHAIADLITLEQAYVRRAEANGPGHPDNGYLADQAWNFGVAAQLLQDACKSAHQRAQAVAA